MKQIQIARDSDLSQPVSQMHSNEQLKAASEYLRGTIAESLAQPLTGSLNFEDTLLTKFYGIYQQDNRDTRQQRQQRKLEPDYQFMVRLRIPGGRLSVAQWQEIDRLASRYASSGIRITTRQTIQLHGVRKASLRPLLKRLRQFDIDTIAACGDDARGVVCGAAADQSGPEREVYLLAKQTSDRLIPKTSAYREIWYQETSPPVQNEEPVYGPLYLPRKFKVGFVIPPLNDVDIFGQDVGYIAIVQDEQLIGFNVCVGGGMGQLDSREDSYPRLATEIGFISKQDAPLLAEIIMGIQRDFGNRVDRHQARFKYTLDRIGMDTFMQLLTERYGKTLAKPQPYSFDHNGDALGWQKTAEGKWQATLFIENGRVSHSLQDKLSAFFQRFAGDIRLTTNQNLQLRKIEDYERAEVEQRLSDLMLDHLIQPTSQQAHTLTCVALPTCGLAMAEAERYSGEFVEKFDKFKADFNLQNTPINLRITGCPNGCARPYLAEIALTGRAMGLYNLYIGGSHRGDRLASLHASNLNETQIFDRLRPLFELYANHRLEHEYFGDFIFRKQLISGSPNHSQRYQES